MINSAETASSLANEMHSNTQRQLDWVRFAHYLGTIALSFEHSMHTLPMESGDIFTADRRSGSPLYLSTTYIEGWGKKRSAKDALLITAFNQDFDIVGVDNTCLIFDENEKINARGMVASAIGADGIASAMKAVKIRAASELLSRFNKERVVYNSICFNREDEHQEYLDDLKKQARRSPESQNLMAQINHVSSERPRWRRLFPPAEEIVAPHKPLETGFCSDRTNVYRMVQMGSQEGNLWFFSQCEASDTFRAIQAKLQDADFVSRKMQKALHVQPR